MKGSQYIREVFQDLTRERSSQGELSEGVFLAAALEVMREIESPLKEEALVRLAVLESDTQGASAKARLSA
jgi:hypothetical protein